MIMKCGSWMYPSRILTEANVLNSRNLQQVTIENGLSQQNPTPTTKNMILETVESQGLFRTPVYGKCRKRGTNTLGTEIQRSKQSQRTANGCN